MIEQIERERDLPGNRLFYLSVAPEFFTIIVEQLAAAGLIHDKNATAWSRVIIEKPFGHDLESARALNAAVTKVLDESQIYRIDHYLGKETVQNILIVPLRQLDLRAALQSEVRRQRADHRRGDARHGRSPRRLLRHAPARCATWCRTTCCSCSADRDGAAVGARGAVDPRREGQGAARARAADAQSRSPRRRCAASTASARQDGKVVKGYRQEEGVDPKSITETYVALRINIDNWRWAGVPFLLRSGKRLAKRVSEIAVRVQAAAACTCFR